MKRVVPREKAIPWDVLLVTASDLDNPRHAWCTSCDAFLRFRQRLAALQPLTAMLQPRVFRKSEKRGEEGVLAVHALPGCCLGSHFSPLGGREDPGRGAERETEARHP